jgi:hypothetical protein
MVFRQVVGSFQILQGSGLVQGFLSWSVHKDNFVIKGHSNKHMANEEKASIGEHRLLFP